MSGSPVHRQSREPLFDAYLMVDWSAKSGRHRASPSPDAPWVAEAEWGPSGLSWRPEQYARSRWECVSFLRERIAAHRAQGHRVLLGFDFSLGYPAGYAKALGLSGAAWRAIWDEVACPSSWDGLPAPLNAFASSDNRNNRFEVASHLNRRAHAHGGPMGGPLHGCPRSEVTSWLRQERGPFPYGPVAYWRQSELALRARRLQPLSSWWVLGGGGPTVGGQILTGLPVVRVLRDDASLGPSRVWPFEGGFTASFPDSGPWILYAEIWPGLVNAALPPLPIRDQAQVHAMVAWAAREDAAGTLGARFAAPPGLGSEELERCVSEEGWILGAH